MLLISVVLTLGAFVYLKQYNLPSAFPVLREPYSVIGLSYVLFRVLHLMIDSHEGMLPEAVSPAAFFNYCCFFPAWLSGPIQRYEDYREQERGVGSVEPSAAQVYEALSRIVTGVFKIAVLSAVLFEVHGQLGGMRMERIHPLHFVVTLAAAAALHTLFMYYNFSGYMDVAIGVAALYGFRLPENFDRPFAAGNLLEFWTRWHITLSAWFRTYLFNPLLRTLVARFGTARSGPYLGVAAYLITFSVMGIWHGSTPVFVVYGLMLGGQRERQQALRDRGATLAGEGGVPQIAGERALLRVVPGPGVRILRGGAGLLLGDTAGDAAPPRESVPRCGQLSWPHDRRIGDPRARIPDARGLGIGVRSIPRDPAERAGPAGGARRQNLRGGRAPGHAMDDRSELRLRTVLTLRTLLQQLGKVLLVMAACHVFLLCLSLWVYPG